VQLFPDRTAGLGSSKEPAFEFRELRIDGGGFEEHFARVCRAGIAFHEVTGRQRVEHLLFRGEIELNRMLRVGDLAAEDKPGDTARGVALLVIRVEVDATGLAGFVGAADECNRSVVVPLQCGKGFRLGRGIEVAG